MWPVKLRGGGCSPDLGWDRSCSWTDWLRVYPWDLRGEDVWPFIACSHPTMGMVQFGTQLCLGTWWVLYVQVQFCVGLKAVNHPLPKLLLLYLTYQKLPLSLFVSGVSHLPRLFCVSKIDAPTLRVPAPGLWASGCHGSALSALKSLLNLCKIIHLLGQTLISPALVPPAPLGARINPLGQESLPLSWGWLLGLQQQHRLLSGAVPGSKHGRMLQVLSTALFWSFRCGEIASTIFFGVSKARVITGEKNLKNQMLTFLWERSHDD